jgi:hypothetical protein
MRQLGALKRQKQLVAADWENSPLSLRLGVVHIIPKTVERAKQIGTSQALMEFEDWLNQPENSSI